MNFRCVTGSFGDFRRVSAVLRGSQVVPAVISGSLRKFSADLRMFHGRLSKGVSKGFIGITGALRGLRRFSSHLWGFWRIFIGFLGHLRSSGETFQRRYKWFSVV